MLSRSDLTGKFVIPKWLELNRALATKELWIPRNKPFILNKTTTEKLNEEHALFKKFPTTDAALDLLSLALIVDNKAIITETMEFLKNIKDFDCSILNSVESNDLSSSITNNCKIDLKIASLKKSLRDHERNALVWIELARLYTIKNQQAKARKAVLIALNLAPYDRYIVRSSVRFFIHYDEHDIAWEIAKKAARNSSDPWIKATEVNTSLLVDKLSITNVKKTIPRDLTLDMIYNYSELIESLGLLELEAGNTNRAKKQFRHAWSNPSMNVVTHGEWVIRNKLPNLMERSTLDFSKSLEAYTWRLYYEFKYDEALNTAVDWELDEPYSVHPYMLASAIACTSEKYEDAIKIIKRGLRPNPDDSGLLNNLSYAYLCQNKVEDAERILNSMPKSDNDFDSLFRKATTGLLNFKKGNILEGRTLYSEAMDLAKKNNSTVLLTKASVHLALAEMEASTPGSKNFARKVIDLSKNIEDPDIITMREKILSKF